MVIFKQKTAYEMRISDWSSDVCSSDLAWNTWNTVLTKNSMPSSRPCGKAAYTGGSRFHANSLPIDETVGNRTETASDILPQLHPILADDRPDARSDEHTSELQSLMRISYAVFGLKKKN